MSQDALAAEPSALHLLLFGPFTVRVEGEPLPRLRSRKGHGLLGLLALRADRAVDRAAWRKAFAVKGNDTARQRFGGEPCRATS